MTPLPTFTIVDPVTNRVSLMIGHDGSVLAYGPRVIKWEVRTAHGALIERHDLLERAIAAAKYAAKARGMTGAHVVMVAEVFTTIEPEAPDG